MAKVTFSTDIQSISGKLCKKEGVIYSVNQRTGKTYRSDRHGYTDKNSEEQQAVRTTFKTRSQAQKTWWAANKPSTSQKDGSTEYQHLMKLYKAQNNIGNPYSFLCTFVQDDGTVTIGTKRVKGGITTDTPAGDTGGTTNPPQTDYEG